MPASETGRRTSWPRTRTWPEVAGISPATMRKSVDLPQPLGPTTETNSFERIAKDRSATAMPVPKDLLKASTSTALGTSAGSNSVLLRAGDREIHVRRRETRVDLERLLHELDRAPQPVVGRGAVAVLRHVSGVDRLDGLLPLGERRVVVERLIVLHHDPGGLFRVLGRVADRLRGRLGELLRLRRITLELFAARHEQVAEDVVAPLGERGEVDLLALARGDARERRHVAVDRGRDQVDLAAQQEREVDAGVGGLPVQR